LEPLVSAFPVSANVIELNAAINNPSAAIAMKLGFLVLDFIS
jgi:hypothetical protein